jgi:hypothetical protein
VEQAPPLQVSAPLQNVPSSQLPAALLVYKQVPAVLQLEKPLHCGGLVQVDPQQTPQFAVLHTLPAGLMQKPLVH